MGRRDSVVLAQGATYVKSTNNVDLDLIALNFIFPSQVQEKINFARRWLRVKRLALQGATE